MSRIVLHRKDEPLYHAEATFRAVEGPARETETRRGLTLGGVREFEREFIARHLHKAGGICVFSQRESL